MIGVVTVRVRGHVRDLSRCEPDAVEPGFHAREHGHDRRDSRQQRVIVFRKGDDGRWERAPGAVDGAVTLSSVALTVAIAALDEDADVPAFHGERPAR